MNNTGTLHVENKNGFLWVLLPDSITMDNYIRIEEEIAETLIGDSRKIVIDMSRTKTLFSSGIGLLIRVKKRIEAAHGELVLVNVNQRLQDLFVSVHLDKIFTIFATDVEFEISRDEILHKKVMNGSQNFVFVSHMERGMCRITISGSCSYGQDMSSIDSFFHDPKITVYVFDLTGLDMVDSIGLQPLSNLFLTINKRAGKIITYGGDEFVKDLFDILTLTGFIISCKDEREAMAKAIES